MPEQGNFILKRMWQNALRELLQTERRLNLKKMLDGAVRKGKKRNVRGRKGKADETEYVQGNIRI